MEGAIQLPGVVRYSVGQLSAWGDSSESDHLVQGLLSLVTVLDGYLPLGVLDRANGGVSMDHVCTRHVFYGVKEEVEGSL